MKIIEGDFPIGKKGKIINTFFRGDILQIAGQTYKFPSSFLAIKLINKEESASPSGCLIFLLLISVIGIPVAILLAVLRPKQFTANIGFQLNNGKKLVARCDSDEWEIVNKYVGIGSFNNLHNDTNPRIRELEIRDNGSISKDISGQKTEYAEFQSHAGQANEYQPLVDGSTISVTQPRKSKSMVGCGLVLACLVVLLIIFCLIVTVINSENNKTIKSNSGGNNLNNTEITTSAGASYNDDKNTNPHKSTLADKPIPESPNSDKDTTPNSKPEIGIKKAVVKSKPITSFGEYPLPFTLVSTEAINLLNAAGKEISIPTGSIINVEKRTQSGTLTTKVNGVMFVGHESRLIGKSKIRP
jgi:hypothetical protein